MISADRLSNRMRLLMVTVQVAWSGVVFRLSAKRNVVRRFSRKLGISRYYGLPLVDLCWTRNGEVKAIQEATVVLVRCPFLTIVTQRHYCKAAACYYVVRSELSVADLQHG